MPLTDWEMQGLRKGTQEWYTDKIDQFRTVITNDAYGGQEDTVSVVVATDIPCMVEPGAAHAQLMPLIGHTRPDELFLIYVPPDREIVVDDEVTITTRGNIRLRISAVYAPETIDIEKIVIGNQLGAHV